MNKQEYCKSIFIPDRALRVMERLWDAGEEVYIVGGCVRDALLGALPHDYDMTVSCIPERTLEIFSDMRTIPTGLKHGTVTVLSDGYPLELTTFRVDGSYSDSRRPDSVSFTRRVEDDLSRRDFTVNAMAYSPRTGLIDLFGGREDLEAGVIRAVGHPATRFGEDALRIMRAFRFSAQLGFSIDGKTLDGACECREGLQNIAAERIGVEFIKLICSRHPERPLRQMSELGILPYASPDYTPEDRIFSLLSGMPENDIARLGFYLSQADRQTAQGVLRVLRCSNKQKSGALSVAEWANRRIETSADATRLRGALVELAPLAVRASVLLGVSDEGAVALVEQSTAPARIGDLAVDGGDLSALGIRGREIGATLHYLLERVIERPELNSREALLELAKKHIDKGE